MDIVVRDVEEVPEQAPEPPESVAATRRAEGAPEAAPEAAPEPPPEPVAKKKSRPLGSKDVKPRAKRPQIIEEEPADPPRARRAKVVYEDPEPPPLQKQASRARAPPAPATPIQVAASTLEILRQEQAARVERKSQLYRSWVQ